MIILRDKEIVIDEDLQLLKALYGCDSCKARAPYLAQLLNKPHHAPINRQVARLGERIVNGLNIPAPKWVTPQ